MREKYIFFIKNMSILTISNFVSKILVFLMLPLYTNVLTTQEYGTIDIISTTINLSIPIFTLSISEAILRYTMEKNVKKEEVLKESLKVIVKGFLILLVFSPITIFFKLPLIYVVIFLIYYLTTAIANALSYYTKGTNNLKLLHL